MQSIHYNDNVFINCPFDSTYQVLKGARERIIKDTPKRGKLTKSQVKRAVGKVVLGKHRDRKATSSTPKKEIVAYTYRDITNVCLGVQIAKGDNVRSTCERYGEVSTRNVATCSGKWGIL